MSDRLWRIEDGEPGTGHGGIAPGQHSLSDYARNVDDIKPPLIPQQAPLDGSYLYYDAACDRS